MAGKMKRERTLRISALDLMFNQAYFRVTFFEEHPQCKECEHVDSLVMDYQIYPAKKKSYCEACEKYEGW